MNAPVTRWGIVEAVSPVASYRVETELAAALPAAPGAQPASCWRRLADGMAYALATPRRRRTVAELSSLTDRELADIGLTRGDVSIVFTPGFITERRAGRRV